MTSPEHKEFFVYRYQLKDGEVVGYHGDSFCTITERKYAKTYPKMDTLHQKAQLEIIRRNFLTIWNDFPSYRNSSYWKGSKAEDIGIVIEKA
jgi:hypothetical protein